MKSPPATATLFLASVLVLHLTSADAAVAAAYGDVIYDIQGNELQKGVSYYIRQRILGPRVNPEVKFSSPVFINETCQVDVVLAPSGVPSTPFTFTPVTEEVIRDSYPLAIESPSENPCNGSTIWKVENREGMPVDIVTTGGVFDTASSCFRIVSSSPGLVAYTIEFCPFMCGAGVKLCYPIGIYDDNGTRHLSPFGSRFEVYFVKAPEPGIAMV